ncbi:MAG TPA: hypothetical protein VII56_16305 [Rhizomicrobium sp.]
MRRATVLAGGVLSLLLIVAPALADDCTPKLLTQLDMIDEPDGRVAVAVGLAGAQHRMLIGTSSMHSELFAPAAAAAGYRTLHLSERQSFDIFGGHASGYAEVDSMTLGTVRGGDVKMLVTPGPYDGDAGVVGVLASDLLGNFEVDLDFKQHKVNLFASNPCDDKRVYWAAQYATLAMDGDGGRMTTTMLLDGKPVQVALDPLATEMRLKFDVAKRLFGLDPTTPGVTPIGERDDGRPTYRYPFASLRADGFAIDKPPIVLFGDPNALSCNGSPHPRLGAVLADIYSIHTCWSPGDLSIGNRRLRLMHLYFAYKARKIYFTAADGH